MEDCPSPVLLLVEDEALIALDTQKRLEKHGYQVKLAHNAATAIATVEADPCISMVLMDIDLGSGMDGTQAARKILRLRDLPVIFMSSHSEPEIIERTETVSSYGYIVKGSAMPAILASLHMAQKLFAAQELAKNHLQELSVFREAVENASDAIGFSTADGRHYYQNRAFTEAFGKIGEHPDEELYIDHAVGREVFQTIMQGRSWNGKALLRDIAGKAHPFHVRAYATRDEYGRLRTLVGLHTDIQNRERMERQIKEERDRAQLYLDMAGVFFLALDRDGKVTMINRRGCTILGLKQMEVLGRNWFDIYLAPEEAEGVKEVFRQIINSELEQVEFHENKIRGADGSQRIIAWHNNVIRDDSGRIAGTISAGEDITERRAAEAALRANEEKHRFLFENMTQGVVYHAPDGTILYANQAAASILGLSIDQLYGKTSLDPRSRSIHEDGTAYPGIMHPSQICLREKKPVHDAIMGVYNPVKENYSWIRINAIPKLTSTGELELVVVIFEDLSEIKQYENSLRQQVEEKNILVKETHHRIKNNIATISSLLSMQADATSEEKTGGSNGKANAALKEAVSRIESMQSLYETMLLRDDFKTVSARDYLTELSAAVLNLFAENRQIRLTTDLQELLLPPKTMFLLGIICNELLTNVMKYAFPAGEGGEVLLSLRQESDILKMIVEDNGCGLPDDFSQKGRNGFGLTLVDMLCQQLKGSLEIVSERGTRMVLRFAT